jgi:heterodisulfide reductase subunit C
MQLAMLGLVDEVLTHDFLWLCATCDSCKAVCPRGVKVSDVMALLRNAAAKAGCVPHGARTQMKQVKDKGRIYDIDEFDNKKRCKQGLPALPVSCDVVKKLLQEE